MNPMQKISVHYSNLTKTEKATCDLITSKPEVVIENPIAEAAKIYDVSSSSILRLSKRLGYKGYTEFRYALEAFKNENEQSKSSEHLYSKVIDTYVETLTEMKSYINEDEINELISFMNSKNIISVGIGNSSLPAQQLVYCLYMKNRIGKCIDDTVKLGFLEGSMDESYVVIIFSVSGNTDLYKDEIAKWKKDHVTIVLITTNPDSSLVRDVDTCFILPTLPIPISSNEYNPKYMDNRSILFAFIDIIMAYFNK
ncbi:MAG: MurR/RpiR family transcriptional regulator [Erysipelotrichaceae bacterium]|nr:MurR/RpiR family transcriptional regulator [Erysipelotrichaceae bacterium]